VVGRDNVPKTAGNAERSAPVSPLRTSVAVGGRAIRAGTYITRAERELMTEKEITVAKRGGELVIRARLQKPRASRSGKTLLLASSHGVLFTGQNYKGKGVAMNLNIFVYAQPKRGAGGNRRRKARKRTPDKGD
jgi:hypothetical protein